MNADQIDLIFFCWNIKFICFPGELNLIFSCRKWRWRRWRRSEIRTRRSWRRGSRRSTIEWWNRCSIIIATSENRQWPGACLHTFWSFESVWIACASKSQSMWLFIIFLPRNLTDISRLEAFVHLRFIDLSNNRLRSVAALNRLKFLLTLKLDSNELSTLDLQPLTYLQTLSVSNNRLRSAAGIEQPRLETLNLNRNFASFFSNFCELVFP